jgi:hypothetical protein
MTWLPRGLARVTMFAMRRGHIGDFKSSFGLVSAAGTSGGAATSEVEVGVAGSSVSPTCKVMDPPTRYSLMFDFMIEGSNRCLRWIKVQVRRKLRMRIRTIVESQEKARVALPRLVEEKVRREQDEISKDLLRPFG